MKFLNGVVYPTRCEKCGQMAIDVYAQAGNFSHPNTKS